MTNGHAATGRGRREATGLRIGIIAPPFLRLPPPGYAGTERVVAVLAEGLHARGHRVTVYAPGGSQLPCEVVEVLPRALWRDGGSHLGDPSAYVQMMVARAWEESARFDVIHSHVETAALLMARYCDTPVVTTLHNRLDAVGVSQLIDLVPEVALVAISESQRRWNEHANWVATIHHGLDFRGTPVGDTPGDYLLLVGRCVPEKGVAEAIEVARRSGRTLVMALKVREPDEQELFNAVVRPAIEDGIVDWRGEVGTTERDRLMAGALATLMLGGWPEPFGLVAIESMATGTPVIARRAGAYPEIVRHGVTGFIVDDVEEAVLAVERVGALSRGRTADHARTEFAADRMVTRYEQTFVAVIAGSRPRRLQVGPAQVGLAQLDPGKPSLRPVSDIVGAAAATGSSRFSDR